MRIEKKYRIEEVLPGDSYSPDKFRAVTIDEKTSTAWATDGRILIRIPVTIEPGDRGGPISPAVSRMARERNVRLGKKWVRYGMGSEETLRRRISPYSEDPVPLRYAKKVLSDSIKASRGAKIIGINASYLWRLVRGMGEGARPSRGVVFLWVTDDLNDPVLVSTDADPKRAFGQGSALGAIMRIRI
jgi:hypothetical protein